MITTKQSVEKHNAGVGIRMIEYLTKAICFITGEKPCHTVKENVTTHFHYARRDMLFYAVTASQRKITRHDAHMKIDLGVIHTQRCQSSRMRYSRVVTCYLTVWHSSPPCLRCHTCIAVIALYVFSSKLKVNLFWQKLLKWRNRIKDKKIGYKSTCTCICKMWLTRSVFSEYYKQELGHSTWQMPPNKCTV